ncbi:MAG: cytochrome c maturation protein CcmE [Cellvibrionaceae bacterium]|nr:cytochrome c maturation protein CcmE [Cellvibrionaceae bacterium]
MHPVRKQRLIIVLFIVVFTSLAVGLMMFALRENINLFYPPSKLVTADAPEGINIRAGGCVVPGSVARSKTDLSVQFDITDGAADLAVRYTGILPDLFAEGEAVVLNGKLPNKVFMAEQVLAKHDENYTPPEVAEAMAQASAETGTGHQASCEGMDMSGNKSY